MTSFFFVSIGTKMIGRMSTIWLLLAIFWILSCSESGLWKKLTYLLVVLQKGDPGLQQSIFYLPHLMSLYRLLRGRNLFQMQSSPYLECHMKDYHQFQTRRLFPLLRLKVTSRRRLRSFFARSIFQWEPTHNLSWPSQDLKVVPFFSLKFF